MAVLDLSCRFCRARLLIAWPGPARFALGMVYERGWTGSLEHGGWACSDDCRAWLARDVTPVEPSLAPR